MRSKIYYGNLKFYGRIVLMSRPQNRGSYGSLAKGLVKAVRTPGSIN